MVEQLDLIYDRLRPEAKLLLSCARTQMDIIHAERIASLVKEYIDWDDLLQMAFPHNLVPLLYRNLEAVAPGAVPDTVRIKLKEQTQVNIQGNLFLTKELRQLLAMFNRCGIPVLPYKGPVLAASVYGDLALRPSNDLDMLVHEQDILEATELLISLGYEIIRPASIAQKDKMLGLPWVHQMVENSPWAYQVVLWHSKRQVVVELHWRITPRYIFPKNPVQLWQDLTPVRLGGGTALSFAPENLLWFLCVHGTKHQWKRLIWVCDIAELIRAVPELSWEQVFDTASQLGFERRLCLGLFLANSLLDAPLPEKVEKKIGAMPQRRALAEKVIERLFDGRDESTGPSYLEQFAFQLKAMDRHADRGRYLLRFAMGSRQ